MCTSVSVYCHYFNAFHEVNPVIISKNDKFALLWVEAQLCYVLCLLIETSTNVYYRCD